MENFKFFTADKINSFIKIRKGETKLGESLSFAASFEELQTSEVKFVIFGIPEDVGVRANFGKEGTAKAWNSFLSSFLNIQANQYTQPQTCMVLGEIDCTGFMNEARSTSSEEELGAIVSRIDDVVSKVVKAIVAAEKVPIIIGGGHNNSYGNIKGTSEALEEAVDILNIDAHTDFRRTDYRHSGNGFSYAKQEGFLRRYAMVGIHKNYTPQYIFVEMNEDKRVNFSFFESYLHLTTIDKLIKFKRATDFVKNCFGLEIDCDSIENFDSSAMTPSGFSINEIRSFIRLAQKQDVLYLHLCEASPEKNPQIGKALSYFVSDFICTEK